MKRAQGFTVIEVIVVVLFLSVATALFFTQTGNLSATHRDDQRKTAINAIYYTLEEVNFADKKSYPVEITEASLPTLDPALLKDLQGVMINGKDSEYRYEGMNCTNDSCQRYTLRADLETEADYIKSSRNKQ